jgi:hypothetical protein
LAFHSSALGSTLSALISHLKSVQGREGVKGPCHHAQAPSFKIAEFEAESAVRAKEGQASECQGTRVYAGRSVVTKWAEPGRKAE